MNSVSDLEIEFTLKPTFNFSKDPYRKIGFYAIEYDKCYIFNANLYYNEAKVKYIKFIYSNKKVLPFDPFRNNLELKNILITL